MFNVHRPLRVRLDRVLRFEDETGEARVGGGARKIGAVLLAAKAVDATLIYIPIAKREKRTASEYKNTAGSFP